MKTRFFLILFILISANICAQRSREALIYVPPIAGTGATEEKAYFYKQITQEVINQFHGIVRLKYSSDFTLKCRIEPFACHHDPFIICPVHPANEGFDSADENPQNVFYLELINSSANELIGGQYIIYTEADESLDSFISVSVYNLLSWIPDIDLGEDIRDRWLFLGVNVMWAPRYYHSSNDSVYWQNFGLGAELEFHFLNFMSVSLGVQFSQDWIVVSRLFEEEYQDLILETPIALKFVLKPAEYFMLQPYGGFAYNFSIQGNTEPCPHTWFAGLQFGVKLGSGFLTIDPRFTMDYYVSRVHTISESVMEYQRYMMQIAVGYKFGFFPKVKR